MKLDEMFKKYPDNLIGFRINANVRVIDFWLDPTWSILEEHVPEEIKLKKQKVYLLKSLIFGMTLCQLK